MLSLKITPIRYDIHNYMLMNVLIMFIRLLFYK
jgi:hypothetical protein